MRTLIVEIIKESESLKMSAFYKDEGITHRHYCVHKISEKFVKDLSANIFHILSRVDIKGAVTATSFEEFRKNSQLLYDQIFSDEIKEKIRDTDAGHLIFYIDEQLIYLPWELLYDGKSFLCLRFATGRIVFTSQTIHTEAPRHMPDTLNMLAVCNPTNDLKMAYTEGVSIRKELDKAKNKIRLTLRTTSVDTAYLLRNIKDFDVLHFAGHAEYDNADPSKSHLVLKDGKLESNQIAKLSDSSSMPRLVFVNSCSSAVENTAPIEPRDENMIYGLANAFLLAGVRHYIGTFWRVMDEQSMRFSRNFYRNIRLNMDIGESLRLARLYTLEKYGQNNMLWAGYVLYGDPEESLLPYSTKVYSNKAKKRLGLLLAFLFIITILSIKFYPKYEVPSENIGFKSFNNVAIVKADGTINYYDKYNIFENNVALGKPMFASSIERNSYQPQLAGDKNFGTRWSSEFKDGQWIYVDLGENTPIGQIRLFWQMAFAREYYIQVSDDVKSWKTVWRTNHGGAENNVIDLRGRGISGRYVRVYCKKRGTKFGNSLWEFEVYPEQLPDVSDHKLAVASSGAGKYGPSNIVDRDMGTRWISDSGPSEWTYVDLSSEYEINMIVIDWEDNFANLYKIQKSNDAKNWTDVCQIENKKKKENNIYFEKPFTARYVRMSGVIPATDRGYSIWEMEIRGKKISP